MARLVVAVALLLMLLSCGGGGGAGHVHGAPRPRLRLARDYPPLLSIDNWIWPAAPGLGSQ